MRQSPLLTGFHRGGLEEQRVPSYLIMYLCNYVTTKSEYDEYNMLLCNYVTTKSEYDEYNMLFAVCQELSSGLAAIVDSLNLLW
jgi:hypothetical protein